MAAVNICKTKYNTEKSRDWFKSEYVTFVCIPLKLMKFSYLRTIVHSNYLQIIYSFNKLILQPLP